MIGISGLQESMFKSISQIRKAMDEVSKDAEVMNDTGFADRWGVLKDEMYALLKDMRELVEEAREEERRRREKEIAEIAMAANSTATSSQMRSLMMWVVPSADAAKYHVGQILSDPYGGSDMYMVAGIEDQGHQPHTVLMLARIATVGGYTQTTTGTVALTSNAFAGGRGVATADADKESAEGGDRDEQTESAGDDE